MSWFYKLPLRLRSLFRHAHVEQDLRQEIDFHVQAQTDEYIANGMKPDEALYAALRSLGGVAQIEEQCREARGVGFIEDFVQDLRFGFRMLRRSPGFSLIAILELGPVDEGPVVQS